MHSKFDHGLFIFCHKFDGANTVCFLAVHVDDGLGTTNSTSFTHLKDQIVKAFGIQDLGPVTTFIGFQFERERNTHSLWLHQKLYINNLLNEYSLHDCNSVTTPLNPNHPLGSNDITYPNIPISQRVISVSLAPSSFSPSAPDPTYPLLSWLYPNGIPSLNLTTLQLPNASSSTWRAPNTFGFDMVAMTAKFPLKDLWIQTGEATRQHRHPYQVTAGSLQVDLSPGQPRNKFALGSFTVGIFWSFFIPFFSHSHDSHYFFLLFSFILSFSLPPLMRMKEKKWRKIMGIMRMTEKWNEKWLKNANCEWPYCTVNNWSRVCGYYACISGRYLAKKPSINSQSLTPLSFNLIMKVPLHLQIMVFLIITQNT